MLTSNQSTALMLNTSHIYSAHRNIYVARQILHLIPCENRDIWEEDIHYVSSSVF